MLFAAVAAMSLLSLFSSHRRALAATFAVIVAGFALTGAATWAFRHEAVSGYAWMALISTGMYLAYVPFGVGLFELLMPGSGLVGTSAFAIQFADGVGYTGSVVIQIYRDLAHGTVDRLAFLLPFAERLSIAGILLMSASAVLLMRGVSDPRGS